MNISDIMQSDQFIVGGNGRPTAVVLKYRDVGSHTGVLKALRSGNVASAVGYGKHYCAPFIAWETLIWIPAFAGITEKKE